MAPGGGSAAEWVIVAPVKRSRIAVAAVALTLYAEPTLAQEGEATEEPAATKEPAASESGAGESASKEATAKEAAKGPEPAMEPGVEDKDFGHRRQFGLRAGVVGGFRMVFRYDSSSFCKEPDPTKSIKDQQKFCGHVGPAALELGISFAPIDSLEPFLWGRFGFKGEAETNTNALVLLGAGVRIYTMSDSAFKIFIEPALGAELEEGAGDPRWNPPGAGFEYKKDLVFHLAAGPQLDVARALGIYLDAGLTTGVLRAIHSSLELQLGLQLRVP